MFDKPNKAKNIRKYGRAYIDHLLAEYRTLGEKTPEADEILNRCSDTPGDILWSDLFRLEAILLAKLSPSQLLRLAWILRARFFDVVGPATYSKYTASGIPIEIDTPAKIELLRADLQRVLEVLHSYYQMIPARERQRVRLTENCIWMVLIYSALLIFFLSIFHYFGLDFLAMLSSVIYAGIIGGFVSSQRRMQNVPNEGDVLASTLALVSTGYYLWLSPLFGAIFSTVLLVVFMSGLIIGPAFPEFAKSSATAATFFSFAREASGASDYAKLLVWAFIAGFAERLVPDTLDSISSKIGTAKRASVTNSGPPVAPST